MASTYEAISGIVISQYGCTGWVMTLQCFGCTLDTWGKCGVHPNVVGHFHPRPLYLRGDVPGRPHGIDL
jgi:hypothetical protein